MNPPIGQNVIITLSSGMKLIAEWDGAQWWAPLNDSPDAAPIANNFVIAWEPE